VHRALTSIPMIIVLMSDHPNGFAVHSGGLEAVESLGNRPVGIRMSDRLAAERRFVDVGQTVTGRDSNAVDMSRLYPGVSAWMTRPFDDLSVIWRVAERHNRLNDWYLSLIAERRLSA
jgi:hypothetical protein